MRGPAIVLSVVVILLAVLVALAAWSAGAPSLRAVARNDDYVVLEYGSPAPGRKLACFDIDGTVMVPRGGFSGDTSGGYVTWQLAWPSVPETLCQLNAQGYSVVLMSNQTALAFDHYNYKTPAANGCNDLRDPGASKAKEEKDFIARMTAFCRLVGIPLVLVGGKRGKWSKPCCGMLELFLKTYPKAGVGPARSTAATRAGARGATTASTPGGPQGRTSATPTTSSRSSAACRTTRPRRCSRRATPAGGATSPAAPPSPPPPPGGENTATRKGGARRGPARGPAERPARAPGRPRA